MPKKNVPPPASTPPPRNKHELETTVALIYDQTKAMREIDLPRIESEAKEAKEVSIDLRSRVSTLESNPPLPHECDEKERQRKQDENINEQGKKLNAIYMLKNGVIWAVLFVCGGALTFAGTTIASNSAQDAIIKSIHEDLTRHESVLSQLPRKSDLNKIQISVEDIPTQVKTKMDEEEMNKPPTIADAVDMIEEVPHIKNNDLQQIRMVLGRVEKRQKRVNDKSVNSKALKMIDHTDELFPAAAPPD